jgi:hypothetical protein
MTTDLPAHDSRMTPDFNYTLEHSIGGDSRLHATETRPRVCEPSGKARLRSKVSHADRRSIGRGQAETCHKSMDHPNDA